MKNQKIQKEDKRYCSECGSEMLCGKVGAEKFLLRYCIGLCDSAYDEETGKRKLRTAYRCPKKTFWNNNHDYYAVGDTILE